MQNDVKIEYEYYNLELNGEVIESVNSKEDAETIKEQLELQDITITQIITENVEEINTHELEVAKNNVAEKTQTTDKSEGIANIDGIEIATLPITGTISSRYGVSSRIRSSTHTGLDIAAITSPAFTSSPAFTYILLVCAYQLSTPFPCSTFTK